MNFQVKEQLKQLIILIEMGSIIVKKIYELLINQNKISIKIKKIDVLNYQTDVKLNQKIYQNIYGILKQMDYMEIDLELI